jgi:hypothetical protein
VGKLPANVICVLGNSQATVRPRAPPPYSPQLSMPHSSLSPLFPLPVFPLPVFPLLFPLPLSPLRTSHQHCDSINQQFCPLVLLNNTFQWVWVQNPLPVLGPHSFLVPLAVCVYNCYMCLQAVLNCFVVRLHFVPAVSHQLHNCCKRLQLPFLNACVTPLIP